MASNLRHMAWGKSVAEVDLGDVDSVPITVGAPPSQIISKIVYERRVNSIALEGSSALDP